VSLGYPIAPWFSSSICSKPMHPPSTDQSYSYVVNIIPPCLPWMFPQSNSIYLHRCIMYWQAHIHIHFTAIIQPVQTWSIVWHALSLLVGAQYKYLTVTATVLLQESFTARMPLLKAASAFVLERRRQSSQWHYLHHPHTYTVSAYNKNRLYLPADALYCQT